MYRSIILILMLAIGLIGCQSVQLSRDFDPSREFSQYRFWRWDAQPFQYQPDDPRIESDLTEQRIQHAIADQLLQRGLRPAPTGQPADVTIRASLVVDQRQEQITTGYGGSWYGGYWGHWGPPMIETRTIHYQLGTLQIDLFDARDGKLVWRGSGQQILREGNVSPQKKQTAIRETVQKILSQYPPH